MKKSEPILSPSLLPPAVVHSCCELGKAMASFKIKAKMDRRTGKKDTRMREKDAQKSKPQLSDDAAAHQALPELETT